MSMHKIPLTALEREGLEKHGLHKRIGKPDQSIDIFRQGVAWALSQASAEQSSKPVTFEKFAIDHGMSITKVGNSFSDNETNFASWVWSKANAAFFQEPLQQRVKPWMLECFGEVVSNDKLERGDRLLEETLETLQSGDYPIERIPVLVQYVYNRPKGEPSQEIGGVMITLAAYCLAHGLDMHEAGEVELARILQPEIIEKIRAKQAKKAAEIPFSPLPQT